MPPVIRRRPSDLPPPTIAEVRDAIADRWEARAIACQLRHLDDAELLALAVPALQRCLRSLEAAEPLGIDLVDAADTLPLIDRLLVTAAQHRGLFPVGSAGLPSTSKGRAQHGIP